MKHKCTPLRTLALQAAYGEISQTSYHQARRKLLSAISEGELSPDEVTHSNSHFQAKERTNPIKLVGFGLLLVAIIFVVGFKPELLGIGQESTAVNPVGAQQPNNPPRRVRSPVEQLMHELLQKNQWGTAEISAFRASWRALDSAERSHLSTSLEFKKLRDRTTMKVNEMEALSGEQGSPLDSEMLLELRRLDNALK